MLVFLVLSFEKSFESPKKITHHFVYFNTSTVKSGVVCHGMLQKGILFQFHSLYFVQENIFSSNCFLILGDQIKNLKKNEHRAMKWESFHHLIFICM